MKPIFRSLSFQVALSAALLLIAAGLWYYDITHKYLAIFALGVATLGLLTALLWQIYRQLTRLLTSLQQLAAGQLNQPLVESSRNLGTASINAVYHKLQEAADFVEKLGETESTAALHSLGPNERLGKALLDIKGTLRSYREDEEKRHWSAQGLTFFADVLRGHSDNITEFGDLVVGHLVRYLQANQGGLFVKTEIEEKIYFELAACYAYEKKKHAEKRVAIGQGLVGQCALEKKIRLLTNVPDQYTTITSGLGEATPAVVVVVPLCWSGEVYGVIELASFTQLADYQLSFLEKVAESIASSLATIRTSVHMQELLQNSQQLTKEFQQLSLVANNTDNSVIIADKNGCIEFVNHGFGKLTGYQANEVLGKKPGHVLQGPDTDPETVKRIRRKLQRGEPFYEEILNYRKSGESYWISLTVNPIRNEQGEIEQYVSIQADVTNIKQQTLDYTYKLEAISRSNAIVEFDPRGTIVDANALFLDIAGYQKEELLGKEHTYLLPETEAGSPQTQMMWDNLKAGSFFSGEFKQRSKQGKELWLSGTFNPIFDLENNLRKIMMFAQFITHEKEKQNDLTGTVQAFAEAVQTFDMMPSGKLKKANALFLQRFGYRRREVSQLTLADLVEDGNHVPDIEAAFHYQNNFQLPFTLITKSGDKIACQCLFTGIRNLEGQLSKIVVIVLENHPKPSLANA